MTALPNGRHMYGWLITERNRSNLALPFDLPGCRREASDVGVTSRVSRRA